MPFYLIPLLPALGADSGIGRRGAAGFDPVSASLPEHGFRGLEARELGMT